MVYTADFTWSRRLEELKRSVFRIDAWRPLQLRTMNATLSGRDCVLIMPTGGGKSLCFHLPALVSSGKDLLISGEMSETTASAKIPVSVGKLWLHRLWFH